MYLCVVRITPTAHFVCRTSATGPLECVWRFGGYLSSPNLSWWPLLSLPDSLVSCRFMLTSMFLLVTSDQRLIKLRYRKGITTLKTDQTHCVFLGLQTGFYLRCKLTIFWPTPTSISSRGIIHILVFRPEFPLLSQMLW